MFGSLFAFDRLASLRAPAARPASDLTGSRRAARAGLAWDTQTRTASGRPGGRHVRAVFHSGLTAITVDGAIPLPDGPIGAWLLSERWSSPQIHRRLVEALVDCTVAVEDQRIVAVGPTPDEAAFVARIDVLVEAATALELLPRVDLHRLVYPELFSPNLELACQAARRHRIGTALVGHVASDASPTGVCRTALVALGETGDIPSIAAGVEHAMTCDLLVPDALAILERYRPGFGPSLDSRRAVERWLDTHRGPNALEPRVLRLLMDVGTSERYLLRAVRAGDPETRSWAIAGLGEVGTRSSLGLLREIAAGAGARSDVRTAKSALARVRPRLDTGRLSLADGDGGLTFASAPGALTAPESPAGPDTG